MKINNRIKAVLIIGLVIVEIVLIIAFFSSGNKYSYVVVASKDIEKYTRLSENDLEIVKVSPEDKELVYKYATSDIDDLVGSVTKESISKGTPIDISREKIAMGDELRYALNEDGSVNNSYFIPYDMRLVTVSLDSVGSINYGVKKGDFVDVIYSSSDGATGGIYSSVLLQHIEVFDVEEVVTDEDSYVSKKQNVTLLVSLDDSLVLVAGNRNGTLNLALNSLSGNTRDVEPVSILAYAPQNPPTKAEEMDSLENYVRNYEFTDETKEMIIDAINREREIETLKIYVEGTDLPQDIKERVMELLGEAK